MNIHDEMKLQRMIAVEVQSQIAGQYTNLYNAYSKALEQDFWALKEHMVKELKTRISTNVDNMVRLELDSLVGRIVEDLEKAKEEKSVLSLSERDRAKLIDELLSPSLPSEVLQKAAIAHKEALEPKE